LRRAGAAPRPSARSADRPPPPPAAEAWPPDTPPAGDRPVLGARIPRLRRAEWLVFVYPTWFGGVPAMLKGWLDRVWVEHVAFDRARGRDRIRARLQQIRRVSVVTTYGSPRWTNMIEGEPGKRLVRRWLRVLFHPLAHSRWIALYGMDQSDAATRTAFLAPV